MKTVNKTERRIISTCKITIIIWGWAEGSVQATWLLPLCCASTWGKILNTPTALWCLAPDSGFSSSWWPGWWSSNDSISRLRCPLLAGFLENEMEDAVEMIVKLEKYPETPLPREMIDMEVHLPHLPACALSGWILALMPEQDKAYNRECGNGKMRYWP